MALTDQIPFTDVFESGVHLHSAVTLGIKLLPEIGELVVGHGVHIQVVKNANLEATSICYPSSSSHRSETKTVGRPQPITTMANPSAAYRDYPDSPRDPPNIDGGDAFELRSRDPRNRYSDALEPPDEEAQSEEERSFYGVRRAETPNSSAVRLRQFAVLAVIAMIFFMVAPREVFSSGRVD